MIGTSSDFYFGDVSVLKLPRNFIVVLWAQPPSDSR